MTWERPARSDPRWPAIVLVLLGVLPLVAVAFALREHLPSVTDPRPFSRDPVSVPLWAFLPLWLAAGVGLRAYLRRTAQPPPLPPARLQGVDGEPLWKSDIPLEERIGLCQLLLRGVLSRPRSESGGQLSSIVSFLYVAMESDEHPALRGSVARALLVLVDVVVPGASHTGDNDTRRFYCLVRKRARLTARHFPDQEVPEIAQLNARLAAWAAQAR